MPARISSRPQPASANTRACSGPITRIASKPSTSFGWCIVCRQRPTSGPASRARATAGRPRSAAPRRGTPSARRRPARCRARRRRAVRRLDVVLGEAEADLARLPWVARSTSPGRPPPTLRMTSCSARPIVELARLPWPSALPPEFIPISLVPGPLQTITGPTGIVVASSPWMLNSSLHAASTAVSTHGRYSGLQPAITAAIATFSTVIVDEVGRHGGDDVGRRTSGSGQHAHHPLLGRRHDGQAVGPAAVEHHLHLVLGVGDVDAPRREHGRTEPHAQRVDEVGVDAHRSAAGAHLGKAGTEPGDARDPFPLRAVPADGAFDLDAVDDADHRRNGLDVVVPADDEVGVVDRRRLPGKSGSSCVNTVRSTRHRARRAPARPCGTSRTRASRPPRFRRGAAVLAS